MNKYCLGNPYCFIADLHPAEKFRIEQELLEESFRKAGIR